MSKSSSVTKLSSSSKLLSIPMVVFLISLPTRKLSSKAIPSSSFVSNVNLITSSKVVVSIFFVESKDTTVPVCVVKVLPKAKVPVTSFNVKLALKVSYGASV